MALLSFHAVYPTDISMSHPAGTSKSTCQTAPSSNHRSLLLSSSYIPLGKKTATSLEHSVTVTLPFMASLMSMAHPGDSGL